MKNWLAYALVAVICGVVGFTANRYLQSPSIATGSPQTTPSLSSSESSASTGAIKTLPEFSLKNREGTMQSIQSWPGKSLIINFWATWCAPCRKEIPLLNSIAKERAKDGYELVGIAIDFRENVLKYLETNPIHYNVLMGEQDGMAAADSFGVNAQNLPLTVFTDNQSRIVAFHLGELNKENINAYLSAVDHVNEGTISPEEARVEIMRGMEKVKSSKTTASE
jgi:thiol-disulfide isomerase/thioredoxin